MTPQHLFRGALMLTVIALLITAMGCAPKPKGAETVTGAPTAAQGPGIAEISVQVVPVTIDSLVVQHQASGTVTPVMQSQVVGQVGGVVARVVPQGGRLGPEG